MLLENLDRTLWTLSQGQDHVGAQIVAHVSADPERLALITKPKFSWDPPKDLHAVAAQLAWEEIQTALRDGDLHAVGRLSTERAAGWMSENDGWRFHSGRHSSIAPEQWRSGQPSARTDALRLLDGHFIDIRLPRFMVLAIWPAIEPEVPRRMPDPETGDIYRTPYLELLERGIAENHISLRNQDKKESLVLWFRKQMVEGEPLSRNLADAMATLIRMPASQRGGGKRGF